MFREGGPKLKTGDEIVSLAGHSLSEMSHYAAWNFIKALPDGPVPIVVIRRTVVTSMDEYKTEGRHVRCMPSGHTCMGTAYRGVHPLDSPDWVQQKHFGVCY